MAFTTTGFGGLSNNTFGKTNNTTGGFGTGFGSTNGFGNTNTTSFGSTTGGFGSGNNTGFGSGFSSTIGGFGNNNNTKTAGGFGSTPSGFGNNNTFGNTGFGSTTTGFGNTTNTGFGSTSGTFGNTTGLGGFGSTLGNGLGSGFGNNNTGLGSGFGNNNMGFGGGFGMTNTATGFGNNGGLGSGLGNPFGNGFGNNNNGGFNSINMNTMNNTIQTSNTSLFVNVDSSMMEFLKNKIQSDRLKNALSLKDIKYNNDLDKMIQETRLKSFSLKQVEDKIRPKINKVFDTTINQMQILREKQLLEESSRQNEKTIKEKLFKICSSFEEEFNGLSDQITELSNKVTPLVNNITLQQAKIALDENSKQAYQIKENVVFIQESLAETEQKIESSLSHLWNPNSLK
ncbi:hypothetical protein ENU1_001160 [Entamoeba nuttalli P19]|uniref:Uncharacterized protein n=1 Tax=Entamoeba nuttalli (strain P19) TaxID=1076696 RepID=K2H8T5_ENTNP|nr:hypothetical protein ENU1_001160 [Entamoeba nuttalli P19]EKE43017.1 hypothetical protein ENU1_001160 [Entamoeba nuttalli P19]|eukprot:XP_008854645.1 hypothetical protein ENU1_001160 [Entamoeba nuttalli P19]